MKSYEKIDYSIRPAKHAERRMLSDIMRRLRPFQRVEDYWYVGFGSVWFADFALFHRVLGIRRMLSIEVGGIQARIEDNKPFNIRVDYRHSNLALPEHNWQERTVAWLDYDDPLSTDILHDINTIAARACSGSLLAVTVQCSQAPEVKHAQEEETKAAAAAAGGEPVNTVLSPVERFFTNFGSNRVPKSTNQYILVYKTVIIFSCPKMYCNSWGISPH